MVFRPQYAGARKQYDVTDTALFTAVTSSASPGFGSSGTIYLGLQAQTRVGFNLTNLIAVNYTSGQKITVTIKAPCRNDGEDIHKFILVGASTNDTSQIYRLAEYKGYETDQVTPTTLPVTIELSTDEHLAINDSVANPAALPSGSDLLNGMGRAVVSTGKFYTYNATSTATVDGDDVLSASVGRWLSIGTLSTAITSLEALPGCNTSLDILDAENDLLVPPPAYDMDGGRSTAIRYWVCNANTGVTEAIPTGTRIGLDIYLNSELKSRLFHGKLKIIFRGYVDLLTGELDTSDMFFVDEIITYVYGKSQGLVLQKPLEADKAYVFDIYLECSAYEFKSLVKQGSAIAIYPYFFTQAGEYSPIGILFGDAILLSQEVNGRRIVPGTSRTVIALRGAGVVDNLQFAPVEKQTVSNLLANTASQKITIDGNGNCFLLLPATATPDTQALRALVGTTTGTSNPSAWSSTRVLATSDKGISVTLNHPCDSQGFGTIRVNYPDVIAGNDEAIFNPSTVTIYLRRQSNSTIYVYTTACLQQPNQTYSITSLSGDTLMSVPTNSDVYFSLYSPGIVTTTQLGTGSLPADTYDVAFAYSYDGNQVTKITHSETDGCITEIPATVANFFQVSSYWDIPLTKTEIRALLSSSLRHGYHRKLKVGTSLIDVEYNIYDANLDDDSNYFKPNDLDTSSPGRWVTQQTGLTGPEIVDLILPFILAL